MKEGRQGEGGRGRKREKERRERRRKKRRDRDSERERSQGYQGINHRHQATIYNLNLIFLLSKCQ